MCIWLSYSGETSKSGCQMTSESVAVLQGFCAGSASWDADIRFVTHVVVSEVYFNV